MAPPSGPHDRAPYQPLSGRTTACSTTGVASAVDFKRLSRGEQVIGVAAFLLIVDLVFLPWHKVSTVRFGQAISGTATGIQFPNSVYGLLALLLAAVMLAQVLFHVLDATVPDVGVPWPKIQRIVGPTVLVLLLVKLLVETRYLSIGAFLAVVLGGALAWGASVSSPGPVRHA